MLAPCDNANLPGGSPVKCSHDHVRESYVPHTAVTAKSQYHPTIHLLPSLPSVSVPSFHNVRWFCTATSGLQAREIWGGILGGYLGILGGIIFGRYLSFLGGILQHAPSALHTPKNCKSIRKKQKQQKRLGGMNPENGARIACTFFLPDAKTENRPRDKKANLFLQKKISGIRRNTNAKGYKFSLLYSFSVGLPTALFQSQISQ